MLHNFTDVKSTLVQVMAWCRQATSHYLIQCWARSMWPYGVTRPQWVNTLPSMNVIQYTSTRTPLHPPLPSSVQASTPLSSVLHRELWSPTDNQRHDPAGMNHSKNPGFQPLGLQSIMIFIHNTVRVIILNKIMKAANKYYQSSIPLRPEKIGCRPHFQDKTAIISTMGFPILLRHLNIESAPWSCLIGGQIYMICRQWH